MASLAGTACTDTVMVLGGVMPHLPLVLAAPAADVGPLLIDAASLCFQPRCVLAIAAGAAALVTVSESLLMDRSPSRGVAAAALVATFGGGWALPAHGRPHPGAQRHRLSRGSLRRVKQSAKALQG